MIVLPSNAIVGGGQAISASGPMIATIPMNIYNLQNGKLFDFTQGGWDKGSVIASVKGMGSTAGFNTIPWNGFSVATLISDNMLILSASSPNVILGPLTNTNDAAGQWLPVFKSPPGEYLFQFIITTTGIGGVLNQQASFKDILYITS